MLVFVAEVYRLPLAERSVTDAGTVMVLNLLHRTPEHDDYLQSLKPEMWSCTHHIIKNVRAPVRSWPPVAPSNFDRPSLAIILLPPSICSESQPANRTYPLVPHAKEHDRYTRRTIADNLSSLERLYSPELRNITGPLPKFGIEFPSKHVSFSTQLFKIFHLFHRATILVSWTCFLASF